MIIRSALLLAGAGAVLGFAVAADASIAIPNDPFVGKRIQASSAAAPANVANLITNPEMAPASGSYAGTVFGDNQPRELLWISGLDLGGDNYETAPVSSDGIVGLRVWTRNAAWTDEWLRLPTELEVRYSTATSGINWMDYNKGQDANWATNTWTEVGMAKMTGLTEYNQSVVPWPLDSTVFTNELAGVNTANWRYADFEVSIPADATSVVLAFNSAQDGPYPVGAPAGQYSGTRIGAVQAMVPEPTTLGFAGLAAIGLLARRRERVA